MTPSIRHALTDLKLDHLHVVYPGTRRYALDLKRHAVITYQLTAAHLPARPANAIAAAVFSTTGTLRVDGVTKTVPLVLTVTPNTDGGLSMTTKVKLKMTAFGVKPPTAMFGLIRSGNAITITATWPLAVKAGA